MTKQQALDFIHGIPRFNKELGLQKVCILLEKLGNPQEKLKFVHVAGTNGKGSTCTMLSYILAKAGYKTGLYISPYVIEFGERIQVNQKMISDEDLTRITSKVKEQWDIMTTNGEPPSEFEVVLAIALLYYVEQQCDIVVLETGMGGRLDATNIIAPPLVSVITNISKEHTTFLGDTLTLIAKEKAAIIKENSIAITYPKQDPEVLAVLLERCADTNSSLVMPHHVEILEQDIFGSKIIYDQREYQIALGGEHQIYNTLVVLEICKVLKQKGFGLDEKDIAEGISNTKFPSRLEVLSRNPLVLLDGAHNLSGAEALANSLAMLQNKKIFGVMGVMKNKDAEGMAKVLGPCFSQIITTKEEDNSLFLDPEELANMLQPYCTNVMWEKNAMKALLDSYEEATSEDVIVICGSLYLASALRKYGMELGEKS